MLLIYSFLIFADLLLIIFRFFFDFYRIYSVKAVIIYPLCQFICIITFIIQRKRCGIKKMCFVTIQNNILLKYPATVAVFYCCFVTIQNNILLKWISASIFAKWCFVTIQNNILLKLNLSRSFLIMCFVTIQNNILLKSTANLCGISTSFVTIQNNILLKCQIRIL